MSQNYSEQELLTRISELETELKQIKKQKKYGLVWENHDEDVVLQCQENVPILKEVKNRKISDKDTNKPTNILIEGDNYHALSVLNYTHKGKVDVIYIDPPYNTGTDNKNKDGGFRYNDKFIDKENSYRHSKWISFIKNRINLSKNLLSNKGVIFISIDDNEVSQLKLLCDEVFGEQNFISQIIWRKKYGGGKGSNFFVDLHEYILCYAKSIDDIKSFSLERNNNQKEAFILKDEYFNERGNYYIRPLKSGLAERKTLIYPIELPDKTFLKTQWICAEETFKDLKNEGRIVFKKLKDGKYNVYKKFYENDRGGFVLPESILYDIAFNQNGKEDLKNLFNISEGRDIPFDNPKPVKLEKYLLSFSSNKNSIILDFFAGSGTTGHAVMELNKQDGGSRQFILCTNNENNICEEVTYERIKRVMKGYKNKKGEMVEGLGGNLRYFKTELCDVGKLSRVTDDKKLALTYRVGGLLALKENTFEETEHTDHWQIFSEHNKSTAVYFSEDKTKLHELIEKLGSFKTPVKLYVFSWSKNEYGSELSHYQHVTVSDIPEPILAVYREINNL